MSDFDPDKFMAERRKSAGGTQKAVAPSFDVDAFMQGRQGKSRPAPISPDSRHGELFESVQDHARRQAAMTPGFVGNVKIGAERGYRKYIEPAISSIAEVTEGMKMGDFGPAWRMAKEAARGTYHALTPPSPRVTADNRVQMRPSDQALQEAQRQREARFQASPEGQRSAQRLSELDRLAGLDPSITGKVTRGATELLTGAAPTIATAVATRGAILPTAIAAAAQSANNPAMMGPNAAMGVLPMPSVRPLIRRLRGRGATTAPTQVRSTQPLAYPDAPVTQRMPAISERLRAENAATAELPGRLPVREPVRELPQIYAEEFDPMNIQLGVDLSPPRQYAGAVGPRAITELGFQAPAQSKAATPPIKPPDIDAGLEKWARQPQQQPLFEAAARTPWQDTVLGYYRANLLTNPVGRATDFASTIVNQFADAAVRPVAAAVDVFVSKLSGKRSITGPSVRGSARAFGSIRQGLRDAREVLRTGENVIDSGADGALYGSEIRSGLGKVADVPINGVFRVLGAMDAPFRRFSFERNLADRARVAAINEAKRGRIPRNQIDARAAQLVDRDDIIAGAIRDGERAVLSEPNKISSWLSRQMQNSPNARLAIGIVQPFMRIPLNAILKGADFAGVGGVKALYKIARGAGRKARGQSFFRDLEEQRVFAQNVAAGSFGVAGFLLGAELEEQGKLEGYYYTSKNDYPSGAVPTSIEIGGARYDINRLGGFILAPLFIGATYSRLKREGSDQADALLRSFSGLAQQAPALGYYGAPAKAGRILTADEPGDEIIKEAGSMTSGFIPASGAVGAAAKAMDPAKGRKAEGFTGSIMSRVPGFRERLPEAAKPQLLDEPKAWRDEQKAAGEKRMFLQPKRADKKDPASKDETPAQFGSRLAVVNDLLRKYATKMVESNAYKKASPEEKAAMREYLREAIGREDLNTELLDPMRILGVIQESAYQGREKERAKSNNSTSMRR